MELAEINKKCEELQAIQLDLDDKKCKFQKIEMDMKKKSREANILEELAKLRGEDFKGEQESEGLKTAKKDVDDCKNKIREIEYDIFEGLKTVSFPIPLEVPKVDGRGKSTIIFEGEPNDCVVKFLASVLNLNVPLNLDELELYPEKIVINNVKQPLEVIEKIKKMQRNLIRLAQSSLGNDPEVEEIVDYLNNSKYRQIWELIRGRKKITYDDVCNELNWNDSKGRKNVRNFFTNLENSITDKFPFIRLEPGVYSLNFFGSLVWKRYVDKYPIAEEKAQDSLTCKNTEAPVQKNDAEKNTLNGYISSSEIKDILYGKGGS